jgi:histone deacetylase 1/2
VARCWTSETAVLVDRHIPEELPPNDYYEYYAPDYRINIAPLRHMDNNNPRPDIEKLKRDVLENLRELAHTPSKGSPPQTPCGRAAQLHRQNLLALWL